MADVMLAFGIPTVALGAVLLGYLYWSVKRTERRYGK